MTWDDIPVAIAAQRLPRSKASYVRPLDDMVPPYELRGVAARALMSYDAFCALEPAAQAQTVAYDRIQMQIAALEAWERNR